MLRGGSSAVGRVPSASFSPCCRRTHSASGIFFRLAPIGGTTRASFTAQTACSAPSRSFSILGLGSTLSSRARTNVIANQTSRGGKSNRRAFSSSSSQTNPSAPPNNGPSANSFGDLLYTPFAASPSKLQKNGDTNNPYDDPNSETKADNSTQPTAKHASTSTSTATPPKPTRDFVLSPWAWRYIIGGAIGLSYVAFHFIVRSMRAQRQYMYRKMLAPLQLPTSINNYPVLDRPKETALLATHLNNPPAGPCLLVGPEGSGKTPILERVINGRKMVIFLDLHRNPVISGEEVVNLFARNTGYLFPPTQFLSRIFLRDDAGKNLLSPDEVNKVLRCFEGVLAKEKAKGWTNGIPLLCINGFHYFGSSNDLNLRHKNIYEEDKDLLKFMDWCLYLTDNKLCHVVFVTSFAFWRSELDTHAGFRSRREILEYGYSSTPVVKNYLQEKVNTRIKELGRRVPLSEDDIRMLATCVGGQVKDLDTAISGIFRGFTVPQVIGHMVTDSLQYVETALESILLSASTSKLSIGSSFPTGGIDTETLANKIAVFQKYLRFWKLMEVFSSRTNVSRRDLIRHVFQEHVHELELYESANLVAYSHRKRKHQERKEQPPTPTTAADGSGGADGKAMEKDGEATATPKHVSAKSEVAALLTSEELPELMVTAGSPRLHIAFQVLLQDPRMAAQKRWIELQVKKHQQKEKKERLMEQRSQLMEERKELVKETEIMLHYSEQWLQLFGEAHTVEKKQSLATQLRLINDKIVATVTELEATEKAMQAIEDETAALSQLSYSHPSTK
ncbi:hypothetical protein QOT17_005164 [Balamuthia mandrillaris]